MKLLYIANARMPTEKAHGLQIMKTIEAFLEHGAEVTLVLPKRVNHINATISQFYNLKRAPHIIFIKNYFGFLENIWPRIYFFLQRIFFGIRVFFFVFFKKVDYIYSRELTISFFLSLLKKNVVFEDHEPKKSFQFIYRWMVRYIPKKVIVANELRNLYQEMGVNKNSFIEVPNGVDLKEFSDIEPESSLWHTQLDIAQDQKIILYVGHFYKWKGVYTLAQAAPDMQGMVIMIGGLSGDTKKLQSFIKEKHIQNVKIVPFVSHSEIIKFLKSAHVLVLPNTGEEERSLKYTTPIKLFEYMASGVPIVASNIPSFEPYLKEKENAMLFLPDNSVDLSSKVNTVLASPKLAGFLAQNAQEHVKEWTWEKRAKKIISFLT